MAEDVGQLNLSLFHQESKDLPEGLPSGLPLIPHWLEFIHMGIPGTREPGKLSPLVRKFAAPSRIVVLIGRKEGRMDIE